MDFQANISFYKMEKSEVCLDVSRNTKEKRPRISSSKTGSRRFKPKTNGTFVSGAVFEMIVIQKYKMTFKDKEGLCFRLNGELVAVPQNEEENKILDKTVWDYLTKRAANNISEIVDKGHLLSVWVAGESILQEHGIKSTNNSKELVYPTKGEQKWKHPWTGAPLKAYRPGYIVPQGCVYTSFSKMCLEFFHSMKKTMTGTFWNDRLDPLVRLQECSASHCIPFVCMFSKQPTFKIRGLCKESVMDTQYKFADHTPGSWKYDSLGYRSFVGPKGWIISRKDEDLNWRMTHYHYTDLSLTMVDQDVMPVGRHKWLVENNACTEGVTSSMVLLISACKEGEFTCDDGKCLDISQRCNNIEVGNTP